MLLDKYMLLKLYSIVILVNEKSEGIDFGCGDQPASIHASVYFVEIIGPWAHLQ